MTENEIISIAYDVNCMPEDCTDASLIRFAHAIAQIKDAEIEKLENRIDRLEWENVGIAEWRAEYVKMKEQRDEYIVKYNETYLALDDCARENIKLKNANEKFINKVNMGLAKSVETYDDLIAVNILLRKGRK